MKNRSGATRAAKNLSNEVERLVHTVVTAPTAVIRLQLMALTAAELAAACARAGIWLGVLDRTPLTDKAGLMQALYRTCEFPAYFGFNWDAVVDCLSDMHFANQHVLALRDARRMPATEVDMLRAAVEAADARVFPHGRRVRLLLWG